MLTWYKADFHIHTVLSPCAEPLMGPMNIIKEAQRLGLDIIAITDHNSAENVEAVIDAAEGRKITVIPGMEVATAEEAHMICLFSSLKDVLSLQEIVYDNLPPIENVESFFGKQLIVNHNDEILGSNSRLLISATKLKVKDLTQLVMERNGIIYPAHINRKAYSLIRQLGFIPSDLNFPVLEITKHATIDEVKKEFLHIADYTFIRGSDAHHPKDLGNGYTMLFLENPDLLEIKKAFLGEEGRKLKINC